MSLEKKAFLFEKEPRIPSLNLAINQYAVSLIQDGKYSFIGRAYYHTPGVILGYQESIKDVNQGFCRDNNIEIVRRLTGGSAITVDPETSICYSLIFDTEALGIKKDITKIYKDITLPLAKRLGNGISVEGTYYLRATLDGITLPFAGHAIKIHGDIVQFDGVVNRKSFDMDAMTQALNLRKLYSLNGKHYIRSNNQIYDLKSNPLQIELDEANLVRDEHKELSRMPGLKDFSITDKEFIDHLINVASENFGNIRIVESLNLDQTVLKSFRKELLDKTSGGRFSGLGHCFVDLVEPEPRIHYAGQN